MGVKIIFFNNSKNLVIKYKPRTGCGKKWVKYPSSGPDAQEKNTGFLKKIPFLEKPAQEPFSLP